MSCNRLKEQCKPTSSSSSSPVVLYTAGIRAVAPYWIPVHLTLQKKATEKLTFFDRLKIMSQEGKSSKWTRPSIRWWMEQMQAGRVFTDEGTTPITPSDTFSNNCSSSSSKSVTLYAQFHFHEQSIMYREGTEKNILIYQDDNYLVVNKPPGVDVLENPAAGRVYNSLPGILLQTELCNGNAKMVPAHRLDSPVSGVVCFGKTAKDSKRLNRRIELGETNKLYVARISIPQDGGGLPPLPLTVENHLLFDKSKSIAYVSTMNGTNNNNGKLSKTTILECLKVFKEDNTALVTIRIHTGRKHQIRCHLQYLNLPIANDGQYGGRVTPREKEEESSISAFGMPDPPRELMEMLQSAWVDEEENGRCEFCQFEKDLLLGKGNRVGPSVNPGIWLHSWIYEFPTLGLKFEAPLPEWASI
eukprot:scaffold9172_cov128-Cylindrotheca_fusiformis.AAC.2